MQIKGKSSEVLKSDLQSRFNSDGLKPIAVKTRYVKIK